MTLENFTTEEKALFTDQHFLNTGSLGRLWHKSIAMNLIREADDVAICAASENRTRRYGVTRGVSHVFSIHYAHG